MVTIIIWCMTLKLISADSTEYDEAHCLEKKEDFSKHFSDELITDELYFHLYTKEWLHTPYNLTSHNTRFLNGMLDTKIIIPGWTEQPYEDWVMSMKNTYLSTRPFNVMVFDWGKYTYYPYDLIPSIVETCGKFLGGFLISLLRQNVTNLDKIHIIAHSVGAHIAGLAGKNVHKQCARSIFRITALNAAGPKYEHALPAHRLFRNDARFVDGYHDDDQVFGMRRAYGTVDFFLSHKQSQILKCLVPPEISCHGIYIWIRCRDRDIFDLWLRSITSGSLLGTGIVDKDHIPIGEHCPETAHGIYNHVIENRSTSTFRRAECANYR